MDEKISTRSKQYRHRKLDQYGLLHFDESQCRCPPDQRGVCGYCFWFNITIRDDEKHPFCRYCQEDMISFKDSIAAGMSYHDWLKKKAKCCRSCFWWDYFDEKRQAKLQKFLKL